MCTGCRRGRLLGLGRYGHLERGSVETERAGSAAADAYVRRELARGAGSLEGRVRSLSVRFMRRGWVRRRDASTQRSRRQGHLPHARVRQIPNRAEPHVSHGQRRVFVGDVRVFTERQRQVSAKARRV